MSRAPFVMPKADLLFLGMLKYMIQQLGGGL